jgi:hypothetical protein
VLRRTYASLLARVGVTPAGILTARARIGLTENPSSAEIDTKLGSHDEYLTLLSRLELQVRQTPVPAAPLAPLAPLAQAHAPNSILAPVETTLPAQLPMRIATTTAPVQTTQQSYSQSVATPGAALSYAFSMYPAPLPSEVEDRAVQQASALPSAPHRVIRTHTRAQVGLPPPGAEDASMYSASPVQFQSTPTAVPDISEL